MEENVLTNDPTIPTAQSDAASADSTAVTEVTDAQEAEESAEDIAPAVDYERQAAEDLAEIKRLIPAYSDAAHLGELPFAMRFAELRDLGLSVTEALAAVHPRFERDTGKSHLRPSVQSGRARAYGVMSAEEMSAARELFGDLREDEIHALYRRVTRK